MIMRALATAFEIAAGGLPKSLELPKSRFGMLSRYAGTHKMHFCSTCADPFHTYDVQRP